jgi:hypothetical protein
VTPTLQASDIDVEGLVAEAERVRGYPLIGRGYNGKHINSVIRKLIAALQSLSAQLAAEKARADKAERERDEARSAIISALYGKDHERDDSLGDLLTALIATTKLFATRAEAAEANLAAANKQIEEMRGAREQALEEAAQVADARKGPREDYGYDAGFNNACEFIARAIRARTALSHEARNG